MEETFFDINVTIKDVIELLLIFGGLVTVWIKYTNSFTALKIQVEADKANSIEERGHLESRIQELKGELRTYIEKRDHSLEKLLERFGNVEVSQTRTNALLEANLDKLTDKVQTNRKDIDFLAGEVRELKSNR